MFKNKYNFVRYMGYRFVHTWALLLFGTSMLQAHTEQTDFYRSLGKMYIVVGVVLILFIGIVLFLVHLQIQVSKLEKQINNERSE